MFFGGATAYANVKKKYSEKLIFKSIASICFVLIGVFSLNERIFSTWQILIVAGLVFSMIGDVFLAVHAADLRDQKLFHGFGLAAFTSGQILYILSFLILTPQFNLLLLILVLTLPVLVIIGQLTKVLEMDTLSKVGTIVYAGVIGAMLATAVNVFLSYGSTTFSVCILIGAISMTVSDFALVLFNYNRKLKNSLYLIAVLVFYYTAQILTALSIGLL